MATDTEILRCHSNELLQLIKSSAEMTESQLEELSTRFDGVYFNPVWDIFLLFFTTFSNILTS